MYIRIFFAFFEGSVPTILVLLAGFVMIRLQKWQFLNETKQKICEQVFKTHMNWKDELIYKEQFMCRNNGPATEHVSRVDK